MKKFILLIFILLISVNAYSASILEYDPLDSLIEGRVLWYEISMNTTNFLSDPNDINTLFPNHLLNPDLSNVDGILKKYWKVVEGDVVEMTQLEKDIIDQDEVNAEDLEIRETAKSRFDGFNSVGLKERAVLELIVEQINILRVNDGLSVITREQAIQAIKDKIDSGEID